jgi:hypothetical protein
MANPGYVFRCKNDPNRTCLQQFLEDRYELTYVHVKPDGDCFFNSIAEYYKRTGEQIHGLDPTDVVALRKFIMERARPIIDGNELMRQQILAEDINIQKKSLHQKKKSVPKKSSQKKEGPAQETNNERLNKIFNKLSERYEYTDAAFDVIVQITPLILNVNLSIYSMTFGTVSNTLHPAPNRNIVPTIILYLSGQHYGLLYPADGPNVRSNAQKRENMEADKYQHNQNNATAALIQKLMEQSNSNQNNENENEENAKKARNASRKVKPSAKSVAKPVAKRNSRKANPSAANLQNNNNMRAAMEESRAMAASHVNNNIANIERQFAALESGMKPSRRNQIASLRQQISQLELKKSVKKRPGVSRKNPMAASVNNMSAAFANVSLRNNHNVPVEANYKRLTANKMRAELIEMGIYTIDDLEELEDLSKPILYQRYKKALLRK